MLKQIVNSIVHHAGFEVSRLHEGDEDRNLYVELFGNESVSQRRFYNISAGGHLGFGCGLKHPIWTNLDVVRRWSRRRQFDPNVDVAYDMLACQPLPIATAAAELVHSRISIEHVTDAAAASFFREVKRALKPGGVFRVVAPNMELDYAAYLRRDRHFFYWEDSSVSMEQAFLIHVAAHASTLFDGPTKERITDEEFRRLCESRPFEDVMAHCTAMCDAELQRETRHCHINWWTPSKLERMLKEAGFSATHRSAAEQSISPVFRNRYHFDNLYINCMLFMDAVA